MHGKSKSTSGPTLESVNRDELAPLRETFLRYIADPAANAALRLVGDLAYQLVLECRWYWLDDEPELEGELRAVAADLRYLQRRLAGVARHRGESSLDLADHERAANAGELAHQVGQLAERAAESSRGGR